MNINMFVQGVGYGVGLLVALLVAVVPHTGHAAGDGTYWTEATTTAWSGSTYGFQYAGSAILDDTVWAVLDDASVWSSEDGIDWDMATSAFTTGITEYWDFSVVTFNDKLWVMGGQINDEDYTNTVWSSDDGITWSVATSSAEWSARSDMSVGVFDGKMWLTGGDSGEQDLWYSEDGIAWTLATSSTSWGEVNGGELIEFEESFWFIGGDGDAPGVWSSDDGLVWELVDEGPWSSNVSYFGAVVFDEKLFVLGGYQPKVWSTEDGDTWELMTNDAPWEDNGGQDAQAFDGKLLVFGGDNNVNTVWYSVDNVDITFNTQGGSSVDTVNGLSGATTTLPEAPTRSGYTFQNWNTASNGSGTSYDAEEEYTFPVSSTTLYAIWEQVNGGGSGGNGARVSLKDETSDTKDEELEIKDEEGSDTTLISLQDRIEQLKTQLADLLARTGGASQFPDGETTGTTTLQVRDLEYGDEGEDVRMLQMLLMAEGYAIPAGATSYFLTQTQTALALYQKDKGIVPAGGYFGVLTRTQMKTGGVQGLWW